MNERALRFENVTYAYPSEEANALDGVDASFDPGAAHLVLGPNGSGKSTLLLAAAGFAPRSLGGRLTGRIRLGDASPQSLPLERWLHHANLVRDEPQYGLSAVRSTVFEEVAFGLENVGVAPADIRARVAAAMRALALEDLAERAPFELSGGQQQRVAIAAVLALEPRVLLLDEPASQLDPLAADQLARLLERVASEGRTVLLATHDLEGGLGMAGDVGRALVLEGGRAVRLGAAAEVLRDEALEDYGLRPPLYGREAIRRVRTPRPSRRADPFEGSIPRVDALAVRCEGLEYAYPGGTRALSGATATFEPGRVTALVGANGSGKSTLAKSLVGLVRPQGGRVRIGPMDARDRAVHELARFVGYAFQNPAESLFERTVRRDVAFGPHALGVRGAALHDAVERALLVCGLEHEAERHPFDLSPSQRRWAALAGVLALETPVLVLDEPGAGFDAHEGDRLERVLGACREAGRTVVLLTHDMRLVAETADDVVVLAGGRVAHAGGARALLADAAEVARLGLALPPAARLARELGLPGLVTEADVRCAVPE